MYRSPKHRKKSWNLNSGAGRDIPAAVFISLQLFLIMERREIFYSGILSRYLFQSLQSLLYDLGFHPAAWISSRLTPAPKNASENGWRFVFPGLCAYCLNGGKTPLAFAACGLVIGTASTATLLIA